MTHRNEIPGTSVITRGLAKDIGEGSQLITCVVFDVDGTIVDTEEAILKSLQAVLQGEGMDYALADLRFALGIPGSEALRRLQVKEIERVHAKWSRTALDFSREVKVFAHMEEVLKKLAESPIRTGIVTSKTRQEFAGQIDPMGLRAYFEQVICADDTAKHKPDPEPLLACLEKLNARQKEAVYIGDSIYDLQCAKSAGVRFALAYWGAKTTEGFAEADYILKQPTDILALITC